jgi:predicted RNase H-like nuclease (RuvC/YqgF family)
VQAPKEINVGWGAERPEPTNTRSVPPDYDGAVAELRKAHREIDYLRNKVRKLEDDKDELKEEKKEYEKKYKKLKDKYDD